jgi:hypothetical protein
MSDLCNLVNKITGCDVSENRVISKDPKARYSKIDISLDSVLTDHELYLAGSFIGVAGVTGSGTCEIKLDYIRSAKLDLRVIEEIKADFTRIYLTSNGKGGTCSLYICQAMETTLKPVKNPFLGIMFNYAYNSKNYVRRLHETAHRRHTQLMIRNTDAVHGVDFAMFIEGESAADFRVGAWRLVAQESLTLHDADMYTIGYCSAVDDASAYIKVLGLWLGR